MTVNRQIDKGHQIFSVSFLDGRPAISIMRKKDFAGFYWKAISNSSCKLAESVGKKIMEYTGKLG